MTRAFPTSSPLPFAALALTAILAAGGPPGAAGLTDEGGVEAAEEAGDAPQIVAPEPVQTLPEAVQGDTVSVTFAIENRGRATLEIERVASGTDGLIVRSAPERLAPGEAGTIRAEKRLGPRDEGAGRLLLHVHSNDPATPRLDLAADMTVRVFVEATPGYARWLYVQGEPVGTIEQTLVSLDGRPFRVEGLDRPHPGLSLAFVAPSEEPEIEGTRWSLRMTLEADAPVGPITGSVFVRLEHPEQKLLEIPVSGFVRPPVAVTPADLVFGEVTLEEPAVQAFDVRVFTTAPVAIEEVTHDLEGVPPATVATLDAGHRYRIDLLLGPETPKGALRGTIRIRTDSERAPLITIPVEGTIR